MTSSTDHILSRILDELTELKVKNSHLEAKVCMQSRMRLFNLQELG